MDVDSAAAANWTRAMTAESRVEWLEAEIERLQAALRRIADDDYTREDELLTSNKPTMIWQAVARQTLGLQ